MAGVYCLLVLVAVSLLDLCVKESVFVSQLSANAVLSRPRRYNSGHLEEVLHKDNLERECIEEMCTMEEARECFENNEKTMEFWAGYIDGDQCDPPPCQNGGQCQDSVGSYICWCKPSFSGKNCEIVVAQQCSVDNGGCSHFCEMKKQRVVCLCAPGYELGSDHRSCLSTEPFSCGLVHTSSGSRSILTPRTSNSATRNNASNQDGIFDFNLTMFYDYYDTDTNDSNQSHVEEGSAVDGNSTVWSSPTMPNMTGEKNTDHRIVGGDEATPGQIPWQVTGQLTRHSMRFSGSESDDEMTGGGLNVDKGKTLVSHREHDVLRVDGQERDHNVSEKIINPNYNYRQSPYNHDIALLRLEVPVVLSDRARPICLGTKPFLENLLRDAPTSLVSGWGRIRFQGPEATKLQKLEVPYVERTACKESSRARITRYMFCAGYANVGKDSCQGDSGGPHATQYKGTWFLTGIVSWGEECARDGKYGVYTRMSQYYPWIAHKTGIRYNTANRMTKRVKL
uniref:Coagulation factor IX n=1 Tax=Neogobius melanostomus TaxID=47308 RepID=A0A8C6WQ96_9GOBI